MIRFYSEYRFQNVVFVVVSQEKNQNSKTKIRTNVTQQKYYQDESYKTLGGTLHI